MWYFRKIDPLSLFENKKHVSFVGAGGKTSWAEYLAARALPMGRRTLITTTTKIWAKEPCAALDEASGPMREGRFFRLGKSVEGRKLTGLTPDELLKAGENYDFVLNEADGAKNMPLKYPASFEPVIPSFADLTVVVAGLDALSATIGDVLFRAELLEKMRGTSQAERVTVPFFVSLFEKEALLKGVSLDRCLVVLNKYDACPERERVLRLAKGVSERVAGAPVLVSSLRHGIFYLAGQQA